MVSRSTMGLDAARVSRGLQEAAVQLSSRSAHLRGPPLLHETQRDVKLLKGQYGVVFSAERRLLSAGLAYARPPNLTS